MESPDFGLVYVMCGDEEEAHRIGRLAVERRLAACANIIPSVRSVYWWEGKIEEASEVLLLLKAPYSYYEELEKLIRAHHKYQVPAIVHLPITQGLPAYLQWIAKETGFDY
ncbi:MAG: divalent-cation tolerance protein CutA [Bacteroidia bacterium]|nr:divalent-cation tolerance protein CutA [Bacteroidia bacterium]